MDFVFMTFTLYYKTGVCYTLKRIGAAVGRARVSAAAQYVDFTLGKAISNQNFACFRKTASTMRQCNGSCFFSITNGFEAHNSERDSLGLPSGFP
ncbi:hypothetical protein HYN48_08445 [Flavobacterium magnum]|uniref:Uncharacterized protein n=1 Tax=Flavobacterium magnum TaxID=2162713 RepID=A0A2S0REN7_9FLAO|nr:hypothetical protein HYN48_08445 [Flavobacterium magnum]